MNLETIEIPKIDQMVFIPTCPRSGSSATAGIFSGLGAFSGHTIGATRANVKGQFENQAIHGLFRKEMTTRNMKASRETQLQLAKHKAMPEIEYLKAKLTLLLVDHGYTGGTAFFKHANFMFHFHEIERQMPDCIWVLPRRKAADVALSMGSIGMVKTEQAALHLVGLYDAALDMIEETCTNVHTIGTDAMIRDGDFSKIRPAIEAAGLVWDEKVVSTWLDPTMFKGARTWAEIEQENKKVLEEKPATPSKSRRRKTPTVDANARNKR
jgi:hypothetical protein